MRTHTAWPGTGSPGSLAHLSSPGQRPHWGHSAGGCMLPQSGAQGQPGGSDLFWEACGHLAGCAESSYKLPSVLNPVGVTIPLREQEASESVDAQRTSPTPAPGRRLYGPEGATLSSVAQASVRMLEGSLMAEAPRRSHSDLRPFPGMTLLTN